MPDVANALLFQRKMTAVETSYLREIERYRREARRAMLEILDRDGVSRAGTMAMRREVDALKGNVTALGRVVSRDIRNVVQNYTRKQVQLAARAGLTTLNDIGGLVAKGASDALDGEQAFMVSTPAWLDRLDTSIATTTAQLRISQASADDIRARLISETAAAGRQSAWAASGTAAALEETRDVWTYGSALLGAYLFYLNDGEPNVTFEKQAIATIDERTTDCCLRVHGQVQPIDEPFKLDGTPRYADEIQDPPFHWYCRSSETLYHPDFEQVGIPTETMKTQAQKELDARARTGARATIYPSHATSQR